MSPSKASPVIYHTGAKIKDADRVALVSPRREPKPGELVQSGSGFAI